MKTNSDRVELLLPFKEEFVSIARLTASGVSSRMGFDIEAIEDIKVAVSEVCSKIVSRGSEISSSYRIAFTALDEKLTIIFDCEDKSLKCIFDGEDEELGVSIINALMDEVELCPRGSYLLSMSKVPEEKT